MADLTPTIPADVAALVATIGDPFIKAAIAEVPPSASEVFRPNINARLSTLAGRLLIGYARAEMALRGLGDGAISGGAITAGSGLMVNIATGQGVVSGTAILFAAVSALAVPASSTARIWLRQDGTFTVTATASAPASTDGHGAALLWGTATTGGSAVTGVSNARVTFGAAPAREIQIAAAGLTPTANTTIRALRLPYGPDGTTAITWAFARAEFHVETAPSGGAATLDIYKNGATILSAPISLASGAADAAAVLAFAVPSGVSGDLIAWRIGTVNGAAGWETNLLARGG